MKYDNEGTKLKVTYTSEIVSDNNEYHISESKKMCASLDDSMTKVELNLADVDNIDSAGLNYLVGFYKEVKAKGCDIGMINVSEKQKQLFDFCKLSDFFEIE